MAQGMAQPGLNVQTASNEQDAVMGTSATSYTSSSANGLAGAAGAQSGVSTQNGANPLIDGVATGNVRDLLLKLSKEAANPEQRGRSKEALAAVDALAKMSVDRDKMGVVEIILGRLSDIVGNMSLDGGVDAYTLNELNEVLALVKRLQQGGGVPGAGIAAQQQSLHSSSSSQPKGQVQV